MIIREGVESRFAGSRPIEADQRGIAEVVLVVDADSTLRLVLAQRLRLAGLSPVAARNWAEAIQLVKLGTPVKLIVLGPSVPMTEACSEPDVADIPTIALPSSDPCRALAETLVDYGYGALHLGDGQGAVEALADTPWLDVIIPTCSTTGCPIRATCSSSRTSGSCPLEARSF